MATGKSMEFDFRKALSQADRIDMTADSLYALSERRFGNTLQRLSASWKGENASLYLSKGSRLQSEMNMTAEELHRIASDIRNAAKRVRDAETAALSLARTKDR